MIGFLIMLVMICTFFAFKNLDKKSFNVSVAFIFNLMNIIKEFFKRIMVAAKKMF